MTPEHIRQMILDALVVAQGHAGEPVEASCFVDDVIADSGRSRTTVWFWLRSLVAGGEIVRVDMPRRVSCYCTPVMAKNLRRWTPQTKEAV